MLGILTASIEAEIKTKSKCTFLTELHAVIGRNFQHGSAHPPFEEELPHPVGAGPEKGHKDGWKHLSCEEKLRELGLFRLQKRVCRGNIIVTFQYF